MSQKLWATYDYLVNEDEVHSTQASSDYNNPLRKCRMSPQPEVEEIFVKPPTFTTKKRRIGLNHSDKFPRKESPIKFKISTKIIDHKDEIEDLHLFCQNFNKKVKISETTYRRTIVPIVPFSENQSYSKRL